MADLNSSHSFVEKQHRVNMIGIRFRLSAMKTVEWDTKSFKCSYVCCHNGCQRQQQHQPQPMATHCDLRWNLKLLRKRMVMPTMAANIIRRRREKNDIETRNAIICTRDILLLDSCVPWWSDHIKMWLEFVSIEHYINITLCICTTHIDTSTDHNRKQTLTAQMHHSSQCSRNTRAVAGFWSFRCSCSIHSSIIISVDCIRSAFSHHNLPIHFDNHRLEFEMNGFWS